MIADASIWRVPVNFSSVSGHGWLAPSASISPYFLPASVLPKIEHSCSGPLKPDASHSALWNWNCRMNDRKYRVYGVLPGMWYLAPGSKSSSLRSTGGLTPWYLRRRSHQALLYSDGLMRP